MVKYKVKEGEALRNTENLRKELTLLSSVACGAPLPMEGGSGTTPCSIGDTRGNLVTQAPSSGRSWELGEALRIGPKILP